MDKNTSTPTARQEDMMNLILQRYFKDVDRIENTSTVEAKGIKYSRSSDEESGGLGKIPKEWISQYFVAQSRCGYQTRNLCRKTYQILHGFSELHFLV